MNKQAISVTLDPSNLVWLRSQATASGSRSISETLDRLILEARTSGRKKEAVRSVVGTIQIAESDPDLSTADIAIRAIFSTSVDRQRQPGAKRRSHTNRGPFPKARH